MRGLYDGFETFRTLTDSDYTTVLGSALVVVDTNVLLNLYQYHADTRAAMVQVLGAIEDRLFVPHPRYGRVLAQQGASSDVSTGRRTHQCQ